MSHQFHKSILRAYDIRGVFNETLNVEDAYYIGKSFAAYLNNEGKNKVVVGYDGRFSSIDLKKELIRGLQESGCKVIEIGLGPTPMLYFAVHFFNFEAGIMVTGSHNPANHNGFKLTLKDLPFFGEQITQLGEIAKKGKFCDGSGTLKKIDIADDYVNRIITDCDIIRSSELLDEIDDFLPNEKQLKVSWDAGNGAAGEIMKKIANKLRTKDFFLFDKIDGSFPNHHPDPTVEANLQDLKKSVIKHDCDLGVAFDGDGDRIGVIDNEANVIWGDQLLAIFSKEVLEENPGATIIADVKASEVLFDEIKKNGGKPLMHKTGHSLIKSKMKEVNSPLAGEMSGHIFFADKYYGFDDALYAAVRLINILCKTNESLSEIKGRLPKSYSTPEIRINCSDDQKFLVIEDIKAALKKDNIQFNDIDGVRAKNINGWWLIRASNTQAALVARCEGKSQEKLDKLKIDLADILNKNKIAIPSELSTASKQKTIAL